MATAVQSTALAPPPLAADVAVAIDRVACLAWLNRLANKRANEVDDGDGDWRGPPLVAKPRTPAEPDRMPTEREACTRLGNVEGRASLLTRGTVCLNDCIMTWSLARRKRPRDRLSLPTRFRRNRVIVSRKMQSFLAATVLLRVLKLTHVC